MWYWSKSPVTSVPIAPMPLSGLQRHCTHKVHTNSYRKTYTFIYLQKKLKILGRQADHTQLIGLWEEGSLSCANSTILEVIPHLTLDRHLTPKWQAEQKWRIFNLLCQDLQSVSIAEKRQLFHKRISCVCFKDKCSKFNFYLSIFKIIKRKLKINYAYKNRNSKNKTQKSIILSIFQKRKTK